MMNLLGNVFANAVRPLFAKRRSKSEEAAARTTNLIDLLREAHERELRDPGSKAYREAERYRLLFGSCRRCEDQGEAE